MRTSNQFLIWKGFVRLAACCVNLKPVMLFTIRTSATRHVVAPLLLIIAFFQLSSAQAAELTNRSPISLWDATVRLEVGGGYRDNVLQSHVAKESSALVSIAGDVSVMRLSETGSELVLLLLGEDIQYADAPSVDGERFAAASAQFSTPLGLREKVGANLDYLYQYQVLDVSETEAELTRVLVEAHSLGFRPNWEHTLTPGWVAQLELGAQRQLYGGDLDDFWESAGKLSLVHTYGRRSDVSVGFQSAHWIYDTREQTDAAGVAINNTSLVYWRPEISVQWRHYWGEARHWRSRTRVSWLWNRDNGSGYYDYDRLLGSETITWRPDKWEFSAGARFGWYRYHLQEIDGERLERWYALLELRAERRLTRRLFLFAVGEREWDFSNDPVDEYNVWTARGGVGVEF